MRAAYDDISIPFRNKRRVVCRCWKSFLKWPEWCCHISHHFRSGVSCGASLWPLMLLIAANVHCSVRRVPTQKEEVVTCVVVNAASIGFTIPFTFGGFIASDHRENWSKMMQLYSYVSNTMVITSLVVLLRITYIFKQTNTAGDRHRNPVYCLLQKLIWYPIVQGITRFCGSLYTFAYGQIARLSRKRGLISTVLFIYFGDRNAFCWHQCFHDVLDRSTRTQEILNGHAGFAKDVPGTRSN